MPWIDLSDQNWPNGQHEYSWARLVFRPCPLWGQFWTSQCLRYLAFPSKHPQRCTVRLPVLERDATGGREKLTSRSSAGEGSQVQAPLWNLEFQFPDAGAFKNYLENLISGLQNQRYWFRRSGVESGFWFLTLSPWDSAVGVWLTIRFSAPELNTLVRKGITGIKRSR